MLLDTRAPPTFPSLPESARLLCAVWTTTPWTLPANRAVAFNPALEYAVLAV